MKMRFFLLTSGLFDEMAGLDSAIPAPGFNLALALRIGTMSPGVARRNDTAPIGGEPGEGRGWSGARRCRRSPTKFSTGPYPGGRWSGRSGPLPLIPGPPDRRAPPV